MKTKRFNWRINEELAAQLAHARRTGGFKSWQDFLQALLNQSQHQNGAVQSSIPGCEAKAEVEVLNRRMMRVEMGQDRLLSLAENHEEILQTMQQEQTETLELFRRMANVLTRALNEGGANPGVRSPQNKAWNSVSRRLPT